MIKKIKNLLKKFLLNLLRAFLLPTGAMPVDVMKGGVNIDPFLTILVTFSPAGFTFATYITFIQQSKIFFHYDSSRIIYLYHFIFIIATLFVICTILVFLSRLFLFLGSVARLARNQSSSNNCNSLPFPMLLDTFKKYFALRFLIIWLPFAAFYFMLISLFNGVEDVFNFRQLSSNWISVLLFFILLILKVLVVIAPVLYFLAVDYLIYELQEEEVSSLRGK